MPQMAPINWLILFIMFSMIFILFNMMNYYYYIPKTQKSNSMLNLKFNSMNWKW